MQGGRWPAVCGSSVAATGVVIAGTGPGRRLGGAPTGGGQRKTHSKQLAVASRRLAHARTSRRELPQAFCTWGASSGASCFRALAPNAAARVVAARDTVEPNWLQALAALSVVLTAAERAPPVNGTDARWPVAPPTALSVAGKTHEVPRRTSRSLVAPPVHCERPSESRASTVHESGEGDIQSVKERSCSRSFS